MIEWLRNLDVEGDQDLPQYLVYMYVALCALLVLVAGSASGLTLALLSISQMDLEVLKRSGSPQEKRCAERIMPVIRNEHFLLVTLVLCNAAATEALPIFLDRLVDPFTAVVLSVTVVLVFGEIVPQAVCTRYGLQVGAGAALLVRAVMVLASPIAWPIGKLLDLALGGEHTALFRRAQLKALVGIHSEAEGLGGTLTPDEISIIQGALDLTAKTAWGAMTPLDKVFMLPAEQLLDEATLQALLTNGHSRVPVYAHGDRAAIIGLVMVKELVLVQPGTLAVGELPLRRLPRLAADTLLYELLRMFETGRSHMAVLTKPRGERAGSASMPRNRSGMVVAGDSAYFIEAYGSPETAGLPAPGHDWGSGEEGTPVGIITIEDVIEELLQQEIVDETDVWLDNEQTARVDVRSLTAALPPRLRRAISGGRLTPRVGRLGHQHSLSHPPNAVQPVGSLDAELFGRAFQLPGEVAAAPAAAAAAPAAGAAWMAPLRHDGKEQPSAADVGAGSLRRVTFAEPGRVSAAGAAGDGGGPPRGGSRSRAPGSAGAR